MDERFFKFSILSKFPEIVHGVSNRRHGDLKFGRLPEEEVTRNRNLFFQDLGIDAKDVISSTQVHGNKIFTVGAQEKGKVGEADGLLTMEKGAFLMITVADCLPVFFYDPVQKIVAIVHAGWKGIVGQIIPNTIEKFLNQHSELENIIVAVGPGICQKHFTVKSEVLKEFLDLYPKATFVINNDGFVDLKKAVLLDLKRMGVEKNNIEISSDCTVCKNNVYGSFRKEGPNTVFMGAIIGMRQ